MVLDGNVNVWYVRGDTYQTLWLYKMDAEIHCRELYPNENADQRYSRVMCKQIHTHE
jgi:hypothetical protein